MHLIKMRGYITFNVFFFSEHAYSSSFAWRKQRAINEEVTKMDLIICRLVRAGPPDFNSQLKDLIQTPISNVDSNDYYFTFSTNICRENEENTLGCRTRVYVRTDTKCFLLEGSLTQSSNSR